MKQWIIRWLWRQLQPLISSAIRGALADHGLIRENSALKPPEMSDMFLAGLPVREAAALEREIERHPEVNPSHWWATPKVLQTSGTV